jgi:hypothetical protein
MEENPACQPDRDRRSIDDGLTLLGGDGRCGSSGVIAHHTAQKLDTGLPDDNCFTAPFAKPKKGRGKT